MARPFVELTDKCNLRCKHCYGDFKLENQHTLSLETLDNLIEQAVKLNVYQFDKKNNYKKKDKKNFTFYLFFLIIIM